MQISTKGRYALRLMLDLAVHNTGELVKIKDISARENISENIWNRLFIIKEGGICKEPERGTGRYMLAREPETYTVGTILRLTEGSMKPVACLEENRISAAEPGNASHSVSGRCLMRLLREYWIRLHCRILKTGMKRWEMIM